ADDADDALRRAEAAAGAGEALSIGLLGNAADVLPALLAGGAPINVVTDQTSAHDPLTYLPRGVAFEDMPALRADDPARFTGRAAGPGPGPGPPRGPGSRWPPTGRPWSDSRTRARRCSTTATRSAARPSWPGTPARSPSPGSCPPTSGRCSARARGRSGGRRC